MNVFLTEADRFKVFVEDESYNINKLFVVNNKYAGAFKGRATNGPNISFEGRIIGNREQHSLLTFHISKKFEGDEWIDASEELVITLSDIFVAQEVSLSELM